MEQELNWLDYIEKSREAVAEGIVLVENKDNVLPFGDGCKLAIFGRMQLNYYKSGTGSGGLVNVDHVYDIVEGLKKSGKVEIDEELLSIYEKWDEKNPIDRGLGWGSEPWSQPEMPLDELLVEITSTKNDVALVIIGRTAGEDKDSTDTEGSFRLTKLENDMLIKVRKYFKKMVVVLNVGGILDMHFVDTIKPEAVLYAWQGGMIGGLGTADVLVGKVCPSGRLADTISYELADCYAWKNFGEIERNFYEEDIYVGYRYFETFAKDKVRYPFGYGLSYTSFSMDLVSCENNGTGVNISIKVKNTGACAGKQVVQIYVGAPMGKLGKASKSLVAFDKTGLLNPGEEEVIECKIPYYTFASYDDSGVTGHPYCYLLEEGRYDFFYGDNVANVTLADSFDIEETVLEQLSSLLAPVEKFNRIKPSSNGSVAMEEVPCLKGERRKYDFLYQNIKYTGDKGYKLNDVKNSKVTMEEFIAQLSDEDMASLIRGEGMGSPKVTVGTAAAFAGVTSNLKKFGVPTCCCDDGPSGMRFDSGAKALSLPIGTLLACTFNRKLNQDLFEFLSLEMVANHVDCLLGPGMNIHRYALNGRNFEYFSEDPLLTGEIAKSQLMGLKKYGVSGCVKHFCCNNQEFSRRHSDSVVSERAIREIYLKGYENIVKAGCCDAIMTTYGRVNGTFTASLYELNTSILREEWGYKGIVMTDWWASLDEYEDGSANHNDFAKMLMAQNDLYMVCSDASKLDEGDNTLAALTDGSLSRSMLEKCVKNVLTFAMNSKAMDRLNKCDDKVTIINRPDVNEDIDYTNVDYLPVGREIVIRLDDRKSVKGTDYVFALDFSMQGDFLVSLYGSSTLGEVAQLPCTLFLNGFPIHTMTFNGTNGRVVKVEREMWALRKYIVLRLNVGCDGLDLKEIRFSFHREHDPNVGL